MGLLLWVHRNQITVGCKELAGHLKSRHPFTQTVVLSLSFGEGSFRRLEKPELIFNFWLPKPPHVWSVDDPRLQNDRGGRECGLGLRDLSTRSEGGRPCSLTLPVLIASPCASQKFPLAPLPHPRPPVTFPLVPPDFS